VKEIIFLGIPSTILLFEKSLLPERIWAGEKMRTRTLALAKENSGRPKKVEKLNRMRGRKTAQGVQMFGRNGNVSRV
jgi:hypothetical protein